MEPSWLKWISSTVAALLAVFLIGGPLWILYVNQRPPEMPEQHRLAWNLKNSSRLAGATSGEVAVQEPSPPAAAIQAEAV